MELNTRHIEVVTPFDPTCAWCLQAAGIKPQKGDSHGICELHKDMEYQEYLFKKSERRKS